MGRTNEVTIMARPPGRQDGPTIGPVQRTSGASLWAFLPGILVGIALGGLG
jgi:hypothetical protein